jgi:exodeoxyribonuclease V alpha subunit
MTDLLARLTEVGVLGPLDLHFARMLASLDPRAAPEVVLGGAWASRAVHFGHVCADLRRILSRKLLDADGMPIEDAPLPALFDWVMALGSGSSLVGDGSTDTPLVFDGGARVYLQRYFGYQQRLASALARRAARVDAIDATKVRPVLDRLFARGALKPDPHQREAAAVAVMRGLTVLSGGPGTGKTTTVVRMLALMQAEALGRGAPPLRISLLSPTGKAAARMVETIGAHVDALDCDDAVKAAIPRSASTIHRLLGYLPGTPTRFLHDAALPVAADVVLVDEASMVDLALLAKLVDAVPETARIVLVGDKDQLASVEAGAILGDICNAGDVQRHARSPWFATRLAALGGEDTRIDEHAPTVADCVVELTTNYRFGETDSGIGGLAAAIKAGRRDDALARLHAARGRERGELRMLSLGEPEALPQLLRPELLAGYRGYLGERDPEQRIARLGEFRLLSPHRRGLFGIDRLNVLVERVLAEAGLIAPDGAWYDGRPVMVTANDYQLQLFNGDVGVICEDAHGRLRAWFGTPGTPLRSFAPSRLPALESVYAMTVHKSQGSEFDRVALLVPPQLSPILTRELLYTGLTRARREALLLGSPEVVAEAIDRRIERASGLRDALWGDAAR